LALGPQSRCPVELALDSAAGKKGHRDPSAAWPQQLAGLPRLHSWRSRRTREHLLRLAVHRRGRSRRGRWIVPPHEQNEADGLGTQARSRLHP
jgi:hypothetical protein